VTRIDSHQHFWRYDPREYDWIDDRMSAIARDFLPGDLAAVMDEAGIDASIAVQARQSDAETDWLIDLARDNDRIAGVVGWIDMKAPDLDRRLAALSGSRKLCGFRHVLQGEPDPRFMLDPAFVAGVRQTLMAGYAYDILIFHHQAEHVPAFLDQCGEGRFIVDHIAKPDIAGGTGFAEWEANLRRIAACPTVYCKLSGMITEAEWATWSPASLERYLDAVLNAFGSDRVMFGSDWPVCLVAGTYRQVHDLVSDYAARHCPDASDAMFGNNAQRAYAL